jgi:hypothetical protein
METKAMVFHSFSEVLTTSWFKYGMLPFITTAVALLVKFNSRPDADPSELGRIDIYTLQFGFYVLKWRYVAKPL